MIVVRAQLLGEMSLLLLKGEPNPNHCGKIVFIELFIEYTSAWGAGMPRGQCYRHGYLVLIFCCISFVRGTINKSFAFLSKA